MISQGLYIYIYIYNIHTYIDLELGTLIIDVVDVAEIRADAKHDPHTIRFSPSAVRDFSLDYQALALRTEKLLETAARSVDTTEWLG